MLPDPPKGAARTSVICILGLGDTGVGRPKFLDEGEDYQPICPHHQWISLVQSQLTEEEVNRPISRPDQQCVPVAASVECKQHTTGPLKPHRPQHVCAVFLITRITRVNEENRTDMLWAVRFEWPIGMLFTFN